MKKATQVTNTKKSTAIACGKAVIAQEIEGLRALSAALDGEFEKAVALVAGLKGRLIVSGMGKSGHIARKIAATMASTGTQAYFVHPSEASHGDLGMIGAEDAVMLLSNSGETAELNDIIAFTRRFRIPLIGMVRRKTSTLVEAADIALVLPAVPEASDTGAPTTSTIMMLALGDAMAMALVERKGFTREKFKLFHPGGSLGKAFLRVEDLMHPLKATPIVQQQELMRKVLLTITAKSFGCAAVVDKGGRLLGVVTDGDLRRHMDASLLSQKAETVMTKNPVTIGRKALAAEALGIMNQKKITSLFVVEKSKPVGILHVHDCLRAGIM